MVTVSSTKFRQHSKNYLDTVEKGETVQIVRHGKVIAHIIPATKKEPSWKKPGLRLNIPGLSLSQIVLKERWES